MDFSFPTGAGGTPEFGITKKDEEVKPYAVYEAEQIPTGPHFPAHMLSAKDVKLEKKARRQTRVSFGKPRNRKGGKGEDDEDDDEEREQDPEEGKEDEEEDGEDEL